MGVMPLPKFSTLYLHFDAKQVNMLTDSSPSIGELGRLHFTKVEVKQIEKERRYKEMGFQAVDISTLPIREFGRKATEPKIGIGENGQVGFNVLVQKAWEGINKVIILFDPDSNRLAFRAQKEGAALPKGIVEGKNLLTLNWGKDKKTGKLDGSLSLKSGSALMNQMKYKFKEAGNQSFPLKQDEKTGTFIWAIPAETPARKPVAPRKPRVKKGTVVAGPNGVNGAPAVISTKPPAEEDLLDIS
jgi:hypothetical protein